MERYLKMGYGIRRLDCLCYRFQFAMHASIVIKVQKLCLVLTVFKGKCRVSVRQDLGNYML